MEQMKNTDIRVGVLLDVEKSSQVLLIGNCSKYVIQKDLEQTAKQT